MRKTLFALTSIAFSVGAFAMGCDESLVQMPAVSESVGGNKSTSATGGESSVSGGSSAVNNQGAGGSSVGSTKEATGGSVAAGGKTTSPAANESGGTTPSSSKSASSSPTPTGTGGKPSVTPGSGGAKAAGGAASGGAASGGAANGGAASGGKAASGGAASGGKAPTGAAGRAAGSGAPGTGGSKATTTTAPVSTAGATSTSTLLDCPNIPPMPTGGTLHSGNGQGGKDNLAWQIWSNGGSGTLTTFSTPAFTAAWNNSGDYLGRLGYEWGNAGKAYTAYGDIKIEYAFKKNGTGGQYSYVGVYGWSTNPCIEWYIVEDSYSAMPFNTGTQPSGTADIDGGTYNLVKRNTTGTGGNRCGNVTAWDQFYSIRKTGSQCGVISVSEHFKTWDAKGWKLGNLLEVKVLVEAAGGQGSVDFSVANVTVSSQ